MDQELLEIDRTVPREPLAESFSEGLRQANRIRAVFPLDRVPPSIE